MFQVIYITTFSDKWYFNQSDHLPLQVWVGRYSAHASALHTQDCPGLGLQRQIKVTQRSLFSSFHVPGEESVVGFDQNSEDTASSVKKNNKLCGIVYMYT